MLTEPVTKRTVAFVDGQNLFYAAKEAFGYTYPNYDVFELATTVCASNHWRLDQVRFYTGVPHQQDHPRWHGFWTAKLAQMGREGVHVYSRPLRYRNQSITLQQRWLKVACAFPSSPTSRNTRGINSTDWIQINRATYDACLDPRDYRPKSNRPS